MDELLKKLREQRNRLWEEMKTILDDTRDNGMTGEDQKKYAALEAEVDRLGKDIDARERARKIEEDLARPQDTPGGVLETKASPYVNEQRAYARAFNGYLKGGAASLSNEDRKVLADFGFTTEFSTRAQSTISGAAGGYLVPEEFLRQIFTHMKWYGTVRSVAGTISTATGGDLMYPNMDDTGNVGAILAENAAISEQDVSVGARTLKAWLYSSKLIRVSWQLVQDSAFDVQSWLAGVIGERLGRIQNTHFTTGVGATQPEGFITNASTVDTATSDVLVLKDIVTLIYSVDRAYRDRGVFQMNDAVIAHLRKEQSTTGEFVWQPSAQAGEPDRLFGYPTYSNSGMAATPTTDQAKVAAFGDFRGGYVIRDVKGLSVVRLDERYADNLQTGFFGYLRTDGQPTFQSSSSVPPYKVLKVA